MSISRMHQSDSIKDISARSANKIAPPAGKLHDGDLLDERLSSRNRARQMNGTLRRKGIGERRCGEQAILLASCDQLATLLMNDRQSPPKFSRRHLVQIAGAGIGMLTHPNLLSAMSSTPDPHVEHAQALREFQYSQIEFHPGIHEAQLDKTHSVLIDMDEDGMLHSFRRYAGLPAVGYGLPGHYELLGAESFGCFISALARYYAIKRDEATRAKVERLVRR